jgi:hypothetical protein
MLPLTKVSHEHHEVLWRFVNQLNDLAECLDCDCLDSGRLFAQLPLMREVHDGLRDRLIPHMDTVEAAVFPTLERLANSRGTMIPMVTEHEEIRRLVGVLGAFTDNPPAHVDRVNVLALRRVLIRLYALLKTHLAEEELYIPILEGRLTPVEEAVLARALDHQAVEPL